MDRREFMKASIASLTAACVPIVVFSRADDPTHWSSTLYESEIGRFEGFSYYENRPLGMPEPEKPRARQNVNAFIHRKAGHYGF